MTLELSSELEGSHCLRLPVSEVIWWWHYITLNSPQTLVSVCPSKLDKPCDVLPWTLGLLATLGNLLLHSHNSQSGLYSIDLRTLWPGGLEKQVRLYTPCVLMFIFA